MTRLFVHFVGSWCHDIFPTPFFLPLFSLLFWSLLRSCLEFDEIVESRWLCHILFVWRFRAESVDYSAASSRRFWELSPQNDQGSHLSVALPLRRSITGVVLAFLAQETATTRVLWLPPWSSLFELLATLLVVFLRTAFLLRLTNSLLRDDGRRPVS